MGELYRPIIRFNPAGAGTRCDGKVLDEHLYGQLCDGPPDETDDDSATERYPEFLLPKPDAGEWHVLGSSPVLSFAEDLLDQRVRNYCRMCDAIRNSVSLVPRDVSSMHGVNVEDIRDTALNYLRLCADQAQLHIASQGEANDVVSWSKQVVIGISQVMQGIRSNISANGIISNTSVEDAKKRVLADLLHVVRTVKLK